MTDKILKMLIRADMTAPKPPPALQDAVFRACHVFEMKKYFLEEKNRPPKRTGRKE